MIDYFSFYGLQISFSPDPGLVSQQFYAFSKKYHPDFFINETDEKQAEVLEMSTVNNKAYQILSDPQKLLPYVLELKGVLNEGENYVLPQSFLMEMMEVNEALMDLQFEPDAARLAALKTEVGAIEADILNEIKELTNGFEALDEAAQKTMLIQIKDLYYRSKYLVRLRESLAAAAH